MDDSILTFEKSADNFDAFFRHDQTIDLVPVKDTYNSNSNLILDYRVKGSQHSRVLQVASDPASQVNYARQRYTKVSAVETGSLQTTFAKPTPSTSHLSQRRSD